MPRLLQRILEEPRPCSYLPGQRASLDHLILADVSAEDYEVLLVRGWRRFGHVYFRPQCGACAECVPLRIPVDRFVPSPSQQRALRRGGRFQVSLERPRVDAEHLALYRAWHHGREAARGWESSELSEDTYFREFAVPHPSGWELAVRDGERLVAVGLCDLTPHAWSAVYFYYHPEIARLSPGVFQIALSVELARQRGLDHVYLGFRVLGCPSLRYKAAFKPHELLVGRPRLDEAPRWVAGP